MFFMIWKIQSFVPQISTNQRLGTHYLIVSTLGTVKIIFPIYNIYIATSNPIRNGSLENTETSASSPVLSVHIQTRSIPEDMIVMETSPRR